MATDSYSKINDLLVSRFNVNISDAGTVLGVMNVSWPVSRSSNYLFDTIPAKFSNLPAGVN